MTEFVLYTNDMELIAVIDIAINADDIETHRRWKVPVPRAFSAIATGDGASFPVADVWAEKFIRNGKPHIFFFTESKELATEMRSERRKYADRPITEHFFDCLRTAMATRR